MTLSQLEKPVYDVDTAKLASGGQTNEGHGMTEEDVIRKSLTEGLQLPADAVDWLCDLYAVTQVFDDFADGDEVTRPDLNRALHLSLVGFHLNPFFERCKVSLLPVVNLFIMKWQGADQAERAGEADEVSFVWRAGFYDVVTTVFYLCHGREDTEANAKLLMQFYAEKFSDYRQEFPL